MALATTGRLHRSVLSSYASIAAPRGFEQITKSNGHACFEGRHSKDHIWYLLNYIIRAQDTENVEYFW